MMMHKNIYFLSVMLLFLLSACGNSKKASQATPGLQSTEYFKLSASEANKINVQQIYIDAAKAKMLEDYSAAVEGFKKVIALDPENHAAHYELAVIYYGSGQNEIAQQYISKALKYNPENKWYLILSAEILGNLKKYEEVITIYKKLIDQYPEEYEYYYNWAFTLLRAGKIKEAIVIYDKLEEKLGIEEELSIQKQKLYLNLNQFDNAVKELEKLIAFNPNETRYYQLLADLYQNNDKPEKANEVYENLLKIQPHSPYAILHLAENARKKNDRTLYMQYMQEAFRSTDLTIDSKIRLVFPYLNAFQKKDTALIEEALLLSRILTEVHFSEAKAFAMYADFLYQANKDTAALQQYLKSLDLDKSIYEVWQQVFFIYNDLRNFNQLETLTEACLEYFPNKPITYFFNGLAKSQLKKYKAAVEILETGKELVIDNDPLKVQFFSSIGDAYHNMEKHAESDNAFEEALKIDEENAYVLNNFSYYLSLRNTDLDKAKKMSGKSLKIDPDNNSYLDTYGWILYKRQEFKEAKKYIEKALEKGGQENAVIVEHYGDVLYKLGEFDAALAQWQKAKTLGSENEMIGKKIANKKLYE